MLSSDTSDEFRQNHRFAQTGTAEQTSLTTTHEGGQQVDDFNPCLEDFGLRRQIFQLRGIAVNGPAFFSVNIAPAINGITQQVEHAAQSSFADRDRNRSTGIGHVHSTHHSLGGTQGHAADASATQVLLDVPVSHLDAAANIELGTSQASLQAGYRANAQAAADCAAQLLDEAADALGVTRPSEVTSGGLSVGHVETGRFPQSSSAALNYGGAQ